MKPLQNASDSELIRHFYSGYEKAFEILFSRYSKDVRHVILHYIRDNVVSEDICQDVFLRVYTSLKNKKYNEQGCFLPWILRIARNLSMDHLRRVAQHFRSENIIASENKSIRWSNGADTRLVLQQQEEQLKGLIGRLSEEQRQVIHYRFFEELSFKEVSTIMNTSINTSLGRMRYGLMNLRKQALPLSSFFQS